MKEITGEDLDADNLIPFMPDSIRKEYLASPDPGIFGFNGVVKQWLETTSHPRVAKWRDDLRRFVHKQYKDAVRRQEIMNDAAPQYYGNGNANVRMKAVIDPVLMAFNRKCFADPEAMKDTKKKEPKLFIEGNK